MYLLFFIIIFIFTNTFLFFIIIIVKRNTLRIKIYIKTNTKDNNYVWKRSITIC